MARHRFGPRQPRAKREVVANTLICHCGKLAYSKSGAARARKQTRQKNDATGREDRLQVYECRLVAGVYHIGNSRRSAGP